MSRRTGVLAVCGSVLAAAIASACCWLPLLLVAFGVSAAGVSARFDAVRPYFLALTAALLGAGFYLNYFKKKPTCEPGGSCATPRPGLQRWNRAVLWLATLVVAAIAFFPNYVGLIATDGEVAVPANAAALETTTLRIEGMTCEACAAHVRKELLAVENVEEASVRYADGVATVFFKNGAAPRLADLLRAVARAGYKAVPD
ncbi:MAG: mercuric transporter MerT family protein [Planctomycetota bacterium]